MRGSHGQNCDAIHVVSACAADSGITLAQEFVGEKSNENTEIPALLEMLELQGQIISIDVMCTQTAIAQAIIEKKSDSLLVTKGNQGNLLRIDKTYNKSTPPKGMRALIDKKYRELFFSLA